ncbi:MAG: DNA internalization-related competence protein ComEC/Rec2 [Thermodesulfobacteriota bacterium]
MKTAAPFTRPLVPLLVALVSGIVLGAHVPGFAAPVLWGFFLFAAGAGALAALRRPVLASLLLAFLSLGYLSIQPVLYPRTGPDDAASFIGQGAFLIQGTVAEPPVWKESLVRAVLDDITLASQGASRSVKGRLRLTLRPARALVQGDRVSFSSDIRGFRDFANPGGYAYERSMLLAGISGTAFAGPESGFRFVSTENRGLVSRVREKLRDAISRFAPEKGRGALAALLLGDRSAVPESVREAFQNSGTIHVLAISGLHVGLVAAFFLLLFRAAFLRVPGLAESGNALRLAGLACLAPVFFYALLAGMSPSTRRAVVMAALFFLAVGVRRPYDPLNTLAAAAFFLAALFPGLVFSVGMQLSFAAVFFILLGSGTLRAVWPRAEEGEGLARRVLRYIGATAAVCVLAFVGTLPLLLHAFHRVSLWAPLANLLVVPLVGLLVLPLGLAGVLALLVWQPAAHLLLWSAGTCVALAQDAAAGFARLPFSSFMPVLPTVPEMALGYGALVCLFFARKARPWRMALVLCLLLLLGDAGLALKDRFLSDTLRVTVLDVGQGSSIVARFPGGYTLVMDAGPMLGEDFDMGERVVAPYLWSRHIHTVDLLVLSHPQMDHLGGMPFLAESFSPREVWLNGQPSGLAAYEQWTQTCRERGIPLRTRSELPDRTRRSGVDIAVLNPARDFCGPCEGDRNVNRNSLALRLALGDTSVLLAGDVTSGAEKRMARELVPEDLCSTALVAPHHGSRGASTPAFLCLVQPRAAVFSVGYQNRFGLPSPAVLARYAGAGARIFRTDRDGAVELEADGAMLVIRPYLKRGLPGEGAVSVSGGCCDACVFPEPEKAEGRKRKGKAGASGKSYGIVKDVDKDRDG